MTVLPRAATAGELIKLRSDNQSSRLYLTFLSPATVYTARLSAVPASTDSVTEITYTSGSGTLANVLADMTLLVGSTAGAYDIGIARIRKDGTTTAGTFYIAEESEIDWQSNAYLTMVNDFDLWPRHIKIASDGTTPLMDYDVAYTNQNQAAGSTPFPIMGSHVVLWLKGSDVSYSPDASASWVNGGTIASYAWTATGASATSDMTTATPTITYNAAGTYRVDLTVTGDNGVSFTGYRYVFVVTEASGIVTTFTLDSCGGDFESGGWSFRVTLYDDATLAEVRDRALVILHSRDWYGTTEGSLGFIPGSENIIAIGRIAGESIQWVTEYKPSFVSFEVQGPNYWLGRMTAFPSGVKDVSDATTPNKWTKFRGLTLNKCWYHFMQWRTTAARCMDVYPNDDTRRIKRLEAPGGQNIWDQLTEIAEKSILARPCCDRYGRIFLEVNQQYLSDRSAIQTVQTLSTSDWFDQIDIERTPTPQVGLVDLSGVAWDGTTATPYFSLANGHVFKHFGSVEVVDRLALVDQNDTNTLAGLYIARRNNNYAKIDVRLAANHRLIDIAPHQRFALSMITANTPRGVTQSFVLIPRLINHEHQSGTLLTTSTFENEVTADLAITGDTPPTPPDPPIVPIDPPIDPPPIDPGLPSDATEIWLMHFKTSSGYVITWSTVANGFVFSTEDNTATWNKISTWPTGFDSAIDETARMAMTIDGSQLYIFRNNTIWQCTNLAAIRATPATTPTWSVIAAVGDSVLGLTLERVGSIMTHNSRLIATGQIGASPRHLVYGEYSGTAWTWYQFSPSTGLGTAATPYTTYQRSNIFYGASVNEQRTYNTITDTLLSTIMWATSSAISGQMWRNNLNGTTYVSARPTPDTTVHIFNADTGGDLYDTGVTDNQVYHIRGAYNGTRVYVTTRDGGFHYSLDGIDFQYHSTWSDSGSADRASQIQDSKRAGNGPLVWAIGNANAGEVVRVSINGVSGTFANKTGNFWTVLSTASAVKLRGMQLVFI